LLLGGAIGKALEAAARPYFEYLTEPVKRPNWELYWKAFIVTNYVVAVLLVPIIFAGMTLIPFACYRAIRDFLTRKSAS
jgi:hypothetical protein